MNFASILKLIFAGAGGWVSFLITVLQMIGNGPISWQSIVTALLSAAVGTHGVASAMATDPAKK